MDARAARGHSRFQTQHIAIVISLCSFVAVAISFHHVRRHATLTAPIDVVGIAVKPTCINERAIAALNRHLQPRSIHVITTTAAACVPFARMAANVICHEEGTLLTGVSHRTVAAYIQQRMQRDGESEFKGRNLAGWYLQQFLKLGAAQAIPTLSDYFVVWDLDMVLLRPLQVLRSSSGGATATVVNVGGARRIPGYQIAYHNLTGRELEFAPDGSSFVTHWMVVFKPFMAQFLAAISQPPASSSSPSSAAPLSRSAAATRVTAAAEGAAAAGDAAAGDAAAAAAAGAAREAGSPAWVWTILDAVPTKHLDMGFSEYASYVSWVKQHHPQSQHILKRRTWVRMPFGESAVRLLQRWHPQRCCCPPHSLLAILRLMHYQYTGYEAGHVEACAYNAPEHAASYCVSGSG